jgi:ubiquinone/menaquinone biosynthesis C-methylase UbiE
VDSHEGPRPTAERPSPAPVRKASSSRTHGVPRDFMAVRRRARRPTRTRRSDHVRRNLALWESQSEQYERRNAKVLSGPNAAAWGLWRVPESELRILGKVRGLDVLELGCGAARWSIALARRGARPVGLDLSMTHLRYAARLVQRSARRLPLVRADAERLPFTNRSFDLVFCDWGAMTFCDPYRTVPEASRVLRNGGRLAFATMSPIRVLAQNRRTNRMSSRLRFDYFGLHRVNYPGEVNFALTYGEWIRLFRENGLSVELLHETRPSASARSRYLGRSESKWARRWPQEIIWSVRKQE